MIYCCCYSDAQLCLTLCNPMDCNTLASLYFTFPQNLLKLQAIESMMPSNHLISVSSFSSCPQCFLASGSFPMSWLFPSSSQSSGASASASVLSMNPELISFKTDWFDLLSVKRTLKSLQHNSLQGHMVTLFVVVQETSIPYSIVAVSIYIPTNSVGGLLFLHTLFSIYYL